MVEPEADSRTGTLRLQRGRGRTGPWKWVLGAAALASVWLAALSSCDAMKSEQSVRDFQDDLVTELCAPGAFYRECWWLTAKECHRELAEWVAASVPYKSTARVRPTEALRQQVFDRLFYHHDVFLSVWVPPAFEKEACMDETRWKHLPPGEEGSMARLRARRERNRRERLDAPPAPAATDTPPTTATPPESSPGTAPEPSSPELPPGLVPDAAPAP